MDEWPPGGHGRAQSVVGSVAGAVFAVLAADVVADGGSVFGACVGPSGRLLLHKGFMFVLGMWRLLLSPPVCAAPIWNRSGRLG